MLSSNQSPRQDAEDCTWFPSPRLARGSGFYTLCWAYSRSRASAVTGRLASPLLSDNAGSVFLQRLVDDSFQFGWHVGIQPHHGRGRRVENGFEDDSRAFPTEGQRPCCHLVEDRAEGEQIRAAIEFLGPACSGDM